MTNLEESITKDNLVRSADKKRASSELLSLDLSSLASASTTLDAAGGSNDQAVITVTLSNSKDLRMFAIPQMTLYVSSVAEANTVYGTTYDDLDFDMWQWLDWGSTDNNNVVLLGFIRNLTGSSKTIIIRVNWRFLIEKT